MHPQRVQARDRVERIGTQRLRTQSCRKVALAARIAFLEIGFKPVHQCVERLARQGIVVISILEWAFVVVLALGVIDFSISESR
ncbi:hypothetical protein GPU89_17230 [Burkholderia cepacia]|nr:hypothetical protein [Burkholderia cepacia]